MANKVGDDKEHADEKKSGKGKLIIIAVVVAVLAAAAYVVGTKSAAPADSGAAATTTTIVLIDGCKTEPEPGVPDTVIDLPEQSINLADGHYLRAAVSLGLCPGVEFVEPNKFRSAPAQDLVVTNLSGADMTVLATTDGRTKAKEALQEQISAMYPGVVYRVFFVEFVMQ